MFIFGDLVIGVMHDENRLLVCNVFSFSIRCINHVSCIIPSIRLNCAVVWAESCGRFRRLYIQKRLKIIAVPEAYGIIFSRNSPESLFSRTDF